jgi:hypothetical protein
VLGGITQNKEESIGIAGVQAEIQPENLPNISLEIYCYTNLLTHCKEDNTSLEDHLL